MGTLDTSLPDLTHGMFTGSSRQCMMCRPSHAVTCASANPRATMPPAAHAHSHVRPSTWCASQPPDHGVNPSTDYVHHGGTNGHTCNAVHVPLATTCPAASILHVLRHTANAQWLRRTRDPSQRCWCTWHTHQVARQLVYKACSHSRSRALSLGHSPTQHFGQAPAQHTLHATVTRCTHTTYVADMVVVSGTHVQHTCTW